MGSKSPALNRIRLTYYEGVERLRLGAVPRQQPGRGDHVGARRASRCALQFMRWDEHGWDNYGPAQMVDIRAGVDANGNLTAFEFTDFGIPYYSTQPAQQQVTAGRRVPELATSRGAGPRRDDDQRLAVQRSRTAG